MWLNTLFPNTFRSAFSKRHIEFWRHVENIKPGVKPSAFFAVWGRGGGKTTTAETAAVRLGAKRARKFCLYVRSTQDKANESIQNIAALLESKSMDRHHPELAERKIGKYGNSKGWRVDTLRCANGFSVVGLGLDAAVRGVKIEDFRPDLIFLDDIDSKDDKPEAVEKKIETLTKDILPAGSTDSAVIGMQNIIHTNSIFAQIVDGTADFLYDRIISGPYPAVDGLEYEEKPEGGYRITAGEPTWEGQGLATCEAQINEWGLSAFLAEAQHEVTEKPGGMFSHLTWRRCNWEDVPWGRMLRTVVWVDPAVTSTDQSDSMGIQCDGLAMDGTIYRLWSWEQITSPEDALQRAISKAIELGADEVGVETDQGGDAWRSVYERALDSLVEKGKLNRNKAPQFAYAKAGAGHGGKAHRASQMLTDYERGRFVHVRGTHDSLERALWRFPKSKPFDLVDAAYWSWQSLGGDRLEPAGGLLQAAFEQ